MAFPTIQTAFSAGEVSPSLWGHVDLAKYAVGCSTLRNVFVNYRGGAWSRAGTAFCGRSKQVPGPQYPPRIITFQFSINVGYCLEFGDNYMRVFSNGAPVVEASTAIAGVTSANPGVVTDIAHGYANGDWVVIGGVGGTTQLNGNTYVVTAKTTNTYELTDLDGNLINTTAFGAYTSGGTAAHVYTLATPWLAGDLPLLKFTQSASVMSLVHQSYPPYDLKCIAANSWVLTQATFAALITAPGTISVTATVHPSSTLSPPTLPTAYAYAVTAVALNGEESVASPIGNVVNSVDIAATAGSEVINWSPVETPTPAQTYNVYNAGLFAQLLVDTDITTNVA